MGQHQERAERVAWKVLPKWSCSVVAVIDWFLFAPLPTPLLTRGEQKAAGSPFCTACLDTVRRDIPTKVPPKTPQPGAVWYIALCQQAGSGGTGPQSAGRIRYWPPVPIKLFLHRILGLLLKSRSPCPGEILVGDAVYPAQLLAALFHVMLAKSF